MRTHAPIVCVCGEGRRRDVDINSVDDAVADGLTLMKGEEEEVEVVQECLEEDQAGERQEQEDLLQDHTHAVDLLLV